MWPSSSEPNPTGDAVPSRDAGGDGDGGYVSRVDVLTVPLQIVFVEVADRGVLLDCLVCDQVAAGPGRTISAGAPFCLVISSAVRSGDLERALSILDRWCHDAEVVEATTRSTARSLSLKVGMDELVLDVA